MGREYSVTFEKVSVSAAQDLVQIKGASGKILRIRRQWVADADVTAPTNTALALRSRFLGATVTDGSGGSSPTPKPFDPGDAAASFTAKANNTTQATSTGTVNILEENACNVFAGYDYMFPFPPIIGPSESFVFELIDTPGATLVLSGGVVVEELGG
jgi:hypothetical protein